MGKRAMDFLIENSGTSSSVIGVDGSPDGKAMIKAGFLEGTAAQSPIKIGEKAVQTAYSYLAGETVKKHVTIPVELITADNLKFYFNSSFIFGISTQEFRSTDKTGLLFPT